MPTHKDLPDNYLDSGRRHGPAGWSTGTWVAIIIAVGLAAGVAGALLLHQTSAASAGPPPKVDARSGGLDHRLGRSLAIGSSYPGRGRAPDLVVTTHLTEALARSRSPMPLVISSASRYGLPLETWTVLERGGSVSRQLVTGRRYGFCFAQAAGDGYRATRGCGHLVMHQFFNGVRLPDGAELTEQFLFRAG